MNSGCAHVAKSCASFACIEFLHVCYILLVHCAKAHDLLCPERDTQMRLGPLGGGPTQMASALFGVRTATLLVAFSLVATGEL